MFRCITTCLLILSGGVTCTDAAETIIFSQILHRHGDRAPYYSYPKNPVPQSFWWQGLQQLTQLGMQQTFELGSYLKQRYINGQPYNLLNSSYIPTEIYVRSTDVDRTLMSAYSNLAGLYPPTGRQVWNQDIKWQPIPVHTIPLSTDNMLYNEVDCPRADQIYANILTTDAVVNEGIANQKFYSYLKNNTGLTVNNKFLVITAYDTLLCQLAHNISLPDWATADWNGVTVFDKLRILDGYQFNLQYNYNDDLRRLSGGVLLKNIINLMTSKINGTISPPNQKMVIYSGHDITIAGLLSSMYVFNEIPPPYASAVMIDLIQRDDESYVVQILYRNDTTQPPYSLHMPGCSDGNCTFDEFVQLTHNVIPADWTNECIVQSKLSVLSVTGGGRSLVLAYSLFWVLHSLLLQFW